MDLINVGTGREEQGGVFELYVWSVRRNRLEKKKKEKGRGEISERRQNDLF